jgi:hypothetical protein
MSSEIQAGKSLLRYNFFNIHHDTYEQKIKSSIIAAIKINTYVTENTGPVQSASTLVY